MRTTLTIEDDVATKLIEIKSKIHKSLKNVVNSLLRSGVEQLDKIEVPAPHYSITSVNLGANLPDLDNISEILAALAIEHGLVVFSSDRDFARFGQLKWESPISH